MNPDRNILATARLVENLADLLPQLRRHIAHELTVIDGHRTTVLGGRTPRPTDEKLKPTPPLGGTCRHNVPSTDDPDELVDCGRRRPCADHDTPVTLTPAERAAALRMHFEQYLADIEQQAKLIAITVHDALTAGRKLIGQRAPESPAQCRDGQIGKDGTIEWGDTTCLDGAIKSGLCGKHYQAWYRWRKAHGLDTSRMFEPAAV